jgi:diguanylate cyclase (GGDEF)-like protein/excisionase family DNA binding protein
VTATAVSRPTDATLSVTKAARLLGVHPNTIRAWSDQGRLRYYRINPRGDRRYRLGDLQSFLTAAEAPAPQGGQEPGAIRPGPGGRPGFRSLPGGRTHHGSLLDAPLRPSERGGHRDARVAQATRQTTDTAVAAPRPAQRRGDRLNAASAGYAGPSGTTLEREQHRLNLRVLAELGSVAWTGRDLDRVLATAVTVIREAYGYFLVTAYELRADRLVLRAAAPVKAGLPEMAATYGTAGRALTDRQLVHLRSDAQDWLPSIAGSESEMAVPIAAGPDSWGVLVVASDRSDGLSERDGEFLPAAARQLALGVHSACLAADAAQQVHRFEALRRVAGDVGSDLDLEQTLSGLVDHATALFGADRAALFLRRRDGRIVAEVARGLSPVYLGSVHGVAAGSLPAEAVAARKPVCATGYADDPRGRATRAAIVQEGFDTICVAPLFDGSDLLGLLNVCHDRPHPWTAGELDTMAAFATQAAIAIKTAQNFTQMATWTAQLQSIQQLGTRLNRLTSVHEIGEAIATELRQLLDYHNVRVYRLYGDDLIPVAMRGQVGEYFDETPDQLRIRVGEGITGWVALHKVAQYLPDAAKDPRASTIVGTEPDLDESMLLAPMMFDDKVLGVVVLSKLGLHQFSEDDLRLLVIYASFAAQAMANADTTEELRAQSAALERQLRSQRALLQITESILTTLDSRAVLDQITERLGVLVRSDNIAIELVDQKTGTIRPLTAKGIHAEHYLQPWEPGEEGIATWVVAHNEPQLIVDERSDERINWFPETGPLDGSLIVVPLRGRDGAVGVLTLERLGSEDRFTEDEFELVKLFAAHVSIALQNAEAHRVLAIRARTDALTGLLNHGTFQDRLSHSVAGGNPFSLIMVDLDDFKRINDALGHQAGDRLLHEIATAIITAGRDSDLVFRYGGDEFTLLLPNADRDGAVQVAERIRATIGAVGAAGSIWHTEGMEVSASIGLATYPQDGASAESVLLAADRACFVAKRSGHGLIATADEGRVMAGEVQLQRPTPVDSPSIPV